MARINGAGSITRVPADTKQPLKFYQGSIELPSHDGKTRRRKVIRDKNKKHLIERLSKLGDELRQRGDLPTASQTVEQWFTYWLEKVVTPNKRPNTVANYRGVVNKHIVPAIGSAKLDKLTATHMNRVIDRMADLGLSNTYQLNAYRIMQVSFAAAIREKRISQNPTALILAPLKDIPEIEVLNRDEAFHLLRFARQRKPEGTRWATSLLTGARRGEVIGLEADRVSNVLDLSWQLQRLATGARGTQGQVGKPRVPADYEYRHLEGGLYLTRPKSRAGWRIVPLVPSVRALLEEHLEEFPPGPNGLVFTNQGRPIDPDQDSRNWRTFLAESGIQKNVRLHDLRHTAVDMMYLAGVPEDIIMEIVGHSTRMVTRGYKSRGNEERLRNAMALMTELIEAPIKLDDVRSEKRALDAS